MSTSQNLAPMKFPVYSTSSGDTTTPCGQLPLACFWAKTLKPREAHKATGGSIKVARHPQKSFLGFTFLVEIIKWMKNV